MEGPERSEGFVPYDSREHVSPSSTAPELLRIICKSIRCVLCQPMFELWYISSMVSVWKGPLLVRPICVA
ncbi:hypothetical protein PILCRDRAFT_827021 [Piloderma croceum F 1598]|uniref:Uncharacterized protein n=1 Tax=Piloderma croceum (strain F 1598) TaxID=765440 RepID=A0A0C3APC1_PILCF|nr:hypothetical protein PILCRDRAFT_827021 [Piloderma croceum F 1598]